MGWLLYTEQETLDTTLPALEAALDAFVEGKALETVGRFGVMPTEVPAVSDPPSYSAITSVIRSAAKAPRTPKGAL